MSLNLPVYVSLSTSVLNRNLTRIQLSQVHDLLVMSTVASVRNLGAILSDDDDSGIFLVQEFKFVAEVV